MSYLVLEAKTKKEEAIIKQFADLMKFDYRKIQLSTYIKDITESRKQIKMGKKISINNL